MTTRRIGTARDADAAGEPSEGTIAPAFESAQTLDADVTRTQSDDAVRDRAYFLYLERGGAIGDADADWFRAERELYADERRGGELSEGVMRAGFVGGDADARA
jgi:hypothetical protein